MPEPRAHHTAERAATARADERVAARATDERREPHSVEDEQTDMTNKELEETVNVTLETQTTSGVSQDRQRLLTLTLNNKMQRALLHSLVRVAPKAALQIAFYNLLSPRVARLYHESDLPEGATSFRLPYRRSFLRGYSWGAGEKTVYLMHGWEGNLGRMRGFIEPLTSARFRVVAFDAPGHGRSGKQLTTLKDVSSASADVAAHFGPPHAIIAHSLGAAATAFTLKEKGVPVPTALVFLSPMKSLREHVDIFNLAAELPPHLADALTAQVELYTKLSVAETDFGRNVTSLSAKGLLVHDEGDDIVPFAPTQRVAASWRSAALYATHGLGHRGVLYDAAVVERVTHFVANAA